MSEEKPFYSVRRAVGLAAILFIIFFIGDIYNGARHIIDRVHSAAESRRAVEALTQRHINVLIYPSKKEFLKTKRRNSYVLADNLAECQAHPSWCLYLSAMRSGRNYGKKTEFFKNDVDQVYWQAGLTHVSLAARIGTGKYQFLNASFIGEKALSGDPGAAFLQEVAWIARTQGLTPTFAPRNDLVARALVARTGLDARSESTRESLGDAQPLATFDLGDRLLWVALYNGKKGPLLLMADTLKIKRNIFE